MNKLKTLTSYAIYTLLCLVLFSCNKLKEGTIINKFYEQPRHYITVEYDVIFKMPMTKNKYDDEDYVFVVGNIIEGDTIIERFEVSSKTYDLFEVGDWIEFE